MLAQKYKVPLRKLPTFFLDTSSSRSRFFSIRKQPTSLPHSRFTVVVGKKTVSKAVARNASKRAVYRWINQKELVHLHKPSTDIMITVIRSLPQEKKLWQSDLEKALQ